MSVILVFFLSKVEPKQSSIMTLLSFTFVSVSRFLHSNFVCNIMAHVYHRFTMNVSLEFYELDLNRSAVTLETNRAW